MQFIPFVTQIALLVAWYTVLPALPAWLVFLPMIMGGIALVIWLILVIFGVFAVAGKAWRR
jgi:hypothetical protein